MLTPHHWLLGQRELSARLWTPRVSIEVTRGGGGISLSVWEPEPGPLLNWSVCGPLGCRGETQFDGLSSPALWVGVGSYSTHQKTDKWPS